MGIFDLMKGEDGWEIAVTFGMDDRQWRARLHKPDDAKAPVYFGVTEPGGTILAALQELDYTVHTRTEMEPLGG